MPTVSYAHSLSYLTRPTGLHIPALHLVMRVPPGHHAITLPAVLDSGATQSLFDGAYLQSIGVALLRGEMRRFQTTGGSLIEARRHRVELTHEQLGRFEMDVAFSMGTIKRNLLGRDFFNLVQIGFRERHLRVLVEPIP